MAEYQNSFEKLIVWQKSLELVKEIYKITAKFPKEEVYGLTSQIKRSSVSIPSNIAEGAKRGSRKDFNQFLRIASGSTAELFTQIRIAKDLYKGEYSKIDMLLEEVQKMLSAMINKNRI